MQMTLQNAAGQKEVLIAVMGATGSGKTTFINQLSGSDLRIGRGLQSCTSVVQASLPFDLTGCQVVLIDTPGFDDTTKSDTDVLRMIAQFLATTYQNGIRLSGVIYMHRISDFRMGGISRRNFGMFRQLCGDSSLNHVAIVTNMWGEVSPNVGEAREAELREKDLFFKPVLDKHAKMLRHDNTLESAQTIVRSFLDNSPEPLRIQRELVDEHKELLQTAAGAELNRELMEQERQHREELRTIKIEMQAAIKARDEETRKELEEESRKLQAEMSRIQMDSQKLESNCHEEQARLEQQVQAIAQQARQEAEKAAAAHEHRLEELRLQLRDNPNGTEADKSGIQQLIDNLQRSFEAHNRSGGGLFSQIGRVIDVVVGFL